MRTVRNRMRTALPAAEVLRRIRASTGPKQSPLPGPGDALFCGTVEAQGFTLCENDGIRNCFRAVLRGMIQTDEDGTLISVTAKVSPACKRVLLLADLFALLCAATFLFFPDRAHLPLLYIPLGLTLLLHLLAAPLFRRVGDRKFKRSGAASAAPLRSLSGCARGCRSEYNDQSFHWLH